MPSGPFGGRWLVVEGAAGPAGGWACLVRPGWGWLPVPIARSSGEDAPLVGPLVVMVRALPGKFGEGGVMGLVEVGHVVDL